MRGYGLSYYELVRVGFFCGGTALVYFLAIRWCLFRWREKRPTTAFERAFDKGGPFVLGLAGVGSLCIAYGFLVAPNRLTVTHYSIETPKLPKGQRVRAVHLADLHVREKGPRERRLPELVRRLKPDLILHSGDFFGKGEGIEPVLVELLRSWDVPQYTCAGNLDGLGDYRGTMRAAGVTSLNNRSVSESVRGARLTITGFWPGTEDAMAQRLSGLPEDTYNIVLYHYPHGYPRTWGTPADLMLAGHTHGGQVRVPLYGALVTLDDYGKRWEAGHFDENGVTLIVSRGLGCEPNTPEVRFWCPPEVVVIELIGTG